MIHLETYKTTLFGLRDSDIEIIKDILHQESEVEKAFIFGSRAKGNYKNGSDVDIALKGTRLNFKICSHISYLLNEETQLPYKFDVLNYHTIASNELIEHIDRMGIEFYNELPK